MPATVLGTTMQGAPMPTAAMRGPVLRSPKSLSVGYQAATSTLAVAAVFVSHCHAARRLRPNAVSGSMADLRTALEF